MSLPRAKTLLPNSQKIFSIRDPQDQRIQIYYNFISYHWGRGDRGAVSQTQKPLSQCDSQLLCLAFPSSCVSRYFCWVESGIAKSESQWWWRADQYCGETDADGARGKGDFWCTGSGDKVFWRDASRNLRADPGLYWECPAGFGLCWAAKIVPHSGNPEPVSDRLSLWENCIGSAGDRYFGAQDLGWSVCRSDPEKSLGQYGFSSESGAGVERFADRV